MTTYKIGDSVKIETPGEKDETGIITMIGDGAVEVSIDPDHTTVWTVWFNEDGTEYRPRYGSKIVKA